PRSEHGSPTPCRPAVKTSPWQICSMAADSAGVHGPTSTSSRPVGWEPLHDPQRSAPRGSHVTRAPILSRAPGQSSSARGPYLPCQETLAIDEQADLATAKQGAGAGQMCDPAVGGRSTVLVSVGVWIADLRAYSQLLRLASFTCRRSAAGAPPPTSTVRV